MKRSRMFVNRQHVFFALIFLHWGISAVVFKNLEKLFFVLFCVFFTKKITGCKIDACGKKKLKYVFKIALSFLLWSTTVSVKSVNLNLISTLHDKWWRFAEIHTGNVLSSAWLIGHNVLVVSKVGEKTNYKLFVHYLDDWVAEIEFLACCQRCERL